MPAGFRGRRPAYFVRDRASARRASEEYCRILSEPDDAIAKGSGERHRPSTCRTRGSPTSGNRLSRRCDLARATPRRSSSPADEPLVDPREALDVIDRSLGRVRHGRPRLHDERPVARLREHDLARRLVERAPLRRPRALGKRCASSTMRSAILCRCRYTHALLPLHQ